MTEASKLSAVSLNLTGDGDDVDLLFDIEKSFCIKLSDIEAKSCVTFGDLFDVVASKVPVSASGNIGYAFQAVFLRLRSGLRQIGFDERISLETDVRPFLRQRGARHIWPQLENAVGLELPRLVRQQALNFVIATTFFGGLIGAALCKSWLGMFLSIACAVAMSIWLPRTILSKSYSRLETLAACVAISNFGKLAKQRGGARASDIWNALAFIVLESSGADPSAPIGRETTFFKKSG
ncbi:MAG TPA: acyl carrier protein [Rhodoblastus sp.]|nr:acyl carrier protein [Rhodoblastus sp.]